MAGVCPLSLSMCVFSLASVMNHVSIVNSSPLLLIILKDAEGLNDSSYDNKDGGS